MAIQHIEVAEVGTIRLQRKRGIKNINLRVDPEGVVRVSQPWMVPRSMVLSFIHSKADWIRTHQAKTIHKWHEGQMLTPELTLHLRSSNSSRPSRSITDNTLIISLPSDYPEAQAKSYLQKCIVNEQKSFTEKEYLPLLDNLAKENGFTFKTSRVKALKSRWGSCDHEKNIILNAYLASLPYDIAEYVLVHELSHTKELNHSPKFWRTVEDVLPNYKQNRKELREHIPAPRPYSVS